MEQVMPPYKLYEYKGTAEEDARQAELMKKLALYEKYIEEIKKETRKYSYKSENGRV